MWAKIERINNFLKTRNYLILKIYQLKLAQLIISKNNKLYTHTNNFL